MIEILGNDLAVVGDYTMQGGVAWPRTNATCGTFKGLQRILNEYAQAYQLRPTALVVDGHIGEKTLDMYLAVQADSLLILSADNAHEFAPWAPLPVRILVSELAATAEATAQAVANLLSVSDDGRWNSSAAGGVACRLASDDGMDPIDSNRIVFYDDSQRRRSGNRALWGVGLTGIGVGLWWLGRRK